MNNRFKQFTYILVIVLAVFLIKDLFSGDPSQKQEAPAPLSEQFEFAPISFPEKSDTYVSQSPIDEALEYARLWNLPEIYGESSRACLDNYRDFHPTTIVRKENLTHYQGIKTGTPYWDRLVEAYENLAAEVCHSYSPRKIVDLYAETMREEFTQSEIRTLNDFYNSALGRKYLQVHQKTNDRVMEYISERQRSVYATASAQYNQTVERLYHQFIEEDGNWLQKSINKLTSE